MSLCDTGSASLPIAAEGVGSITDWTSSDRRLTDVVPGMRCVRDAGSSMLVASRCRICLPKRSRYLRETKGSGGEQQDRRNAMWHGKANAGHRLW